VTAVVIKPGQTLGILGGGQLGKMIAIEARRLGYRVKVLDPDVACPASEVADIVQGEWSDPTAALELALASDVVTLETEHVPYEVLAEVEKVRPLRPSAQVLKTIQDRLNQRQFLHRHDLPQTRWANVESLAQLQAALAEIGSPAILKRRKGGYDGRAQVRIYAAQEADAAWRALGEEPCILEAFVDFTAELSVVLARSAQGEIRFFAAAENVHRNGILHTTVAPGRFPEAILEAAEELATRAAVALQIVGVLTVELFLTRDDRLLINEMAPRVHNSGHFTLGACATSQFEQQLRAVCGLPLGSQSQHLPAAMVNLLGDLWANGEPDFLPVLADSRAHLHLYGKREARPGRKMGHITVLGDTTHEALAVAELLYAQLANR
jgi:5-(carboxyamino)imidazole ribonucleotide synthase